MIAEEAARVGATRRVAATLHISIRTVEFHLSGVYRKLGVPRARGCRTRSTATSVTSRDEPCELIDEDRLRARRPDRPWNPAPCR